MMSYDKRYTRKVDARVSGRFVGALKSFLADAIFFISGNEFSALMIKIGQQCSTF